MKPGPRLTDLACVAVVAAQLTLGGVHPLATFGWRDFVEVAAWGAAAVLLRRAPADWRGSPGAPAAFVLLAAVLRTLPTVELSTMELSSTAASTGLFAGLFAGLSPIPHPFAVLGAGGAALVLVRVVDDLLRGRGLLVVPLTVLAAVAARTDTVIDAHVGVRLVPELLSVVWPLLGIAALGAALGAVADHRSPRSFFREPGLPLAGVAPLLLLLPALLSRYVPAPSSSLPASVIAPPIVLITVDTLRADEAERMPSFARVGRSGAWWPRAMSTASWTLPALASLHTGLLPREHGAGALPGPRPVPIRDTVRTLAERLQARGYYTASFVTNVFTAAELGFTRGFDLRVHPEENLFERRAFTGAEAPPTPTEAALRWIPSAPDSGVFLWVHLMEPHIPYAHPPTDPASPLVVALGGDPSRLRASLVRSGMVQLNEAAREELRETYRRGCDDADARVNELLDAVEARWPDAIVVLTADHGEELFDHGGFEHGHNHHGEVLDVGLAIRGGGMSRGTRTDVASLADVMPTLLAMLGEPGAVDLRQVQPESRIVTADGNVYFGAGVSARQGHRRAIVGLGEYDLVADPTEHHPLPAGPLTAAAAAAAGVPAGGSAADDRALTLPEGQLRALGYVE